MERINYSTNQYGDINYNGRTIHLTQQAYLAGSNERPLYQANASDEDGNEYLVTWMPYDNYQDLMRDGDESDCCDWDDYSVTEI